MTTIQKNWFLLILLLLLSLFVVYGTTIPFKFTNFHAAVAKCSAISWHPFKGANGGWTSRFDLVQNVILFFPAGVVLGMLFGRLKKRGLGILVSFFYGVILSCGVEVIQLFTADRIVSITDVICNSAGSVLGCFSVITILTKNESRFYKHWTVTARILFVPAIASVFVIVEFLRPFDFSLDTSMVFEKARLLFAHPLKWYPAIRNAPVIVLFYALLTYTLFQGKWFSLLRKGKRFLAVVLLIISIFILSVCQLIVISRLPAGLDFIAAIAGIILGILFCTFREPVRIALFKLLVFTSIFSMYQFPFTTASEYQKGNWSPHLFKCSSTLMWYAGHIIELAVFFTFAGFATAYLVKNTSLRRALLVFDIGVILTLEAFQIGTNGFYAGISDLLIITGALCAGCLLGKYVN